MEEQNYNQTPPPNNPNPNPQGFYVQPPLPNAAGVLVLGILSIVFCWGYGIVGIVLGIIALSLAGKANLLVTQNPGIYSPSSISNMKAGKVCAIIGLVLSAIFLIYIIIVIAFVGAIFTNMPWDQMNY